ncbi:hypothetical protein IVB15_26480 [Bradyrhizobium sp. 182]|uniref:hypothetical protein n=1 Tax=Bradyrhizobium sp. 182 TaxID=2782651 RepID=UPI001FF878C8|nr:hypothetical protein [Bradyrhizobium sp. 182]MCK1531157.1 hypothetical protein [Bradyrhizobium sp. 182]
MAGDTPAWWSTLEEQSAKDGINSDFLRRVGGQESGFHNIGSDTSSASGPFQFIKGTWEGLSKRNSDLSLTNRFDPEQQARAIPRFTKENLDIMEGALGRRVSGGEAYLAHFLGTGDAPRVVKASDDTPIQNVVQPQSYAANPAVFGKYKTVGQLRAWADRVSGGVSPYGDNYTQSPQGAATPTQRATNVPTEVPPVEGAQLTSQTTRPAEPVTRNELRDMEIDARSAAPAFGEAAISAVVNESALKWAFHGDDKYVPNPDFRWTDDLYKKVTEGIPQENWGYFDRAHSEAHAMWLRNEMLKDMGYERDMDALGGTGTALKLFGAIVDPVGWAAGAIAAPVGGLAKGSRLGIILARAAEGGIAGLAQAAPSVLNKPTAHPLDLLYAGAGGMMLGSAFGALARNPAAADLAEKGASIGKSMMQDIEAQAIRGESSVGAAQASPRMAVRTDTYDWLGAPVEDVAPKAVFGKARFDFAAQLGTSENVATRLLGANLVEDAVGRAKGLETPFSVSETQRKVQLGFETRYMQDYGSNFKSWADDLKLNWAERQSREGEFRQAVTEAIRNQDPSVTFHPAVQKQAAANAKLYADYRELLVNPGVIDGTARRPVLSPDVPQNGNYVPRIVSREKFQEWSRRFGDRQIGQFIAQAVRGLNPDIDADLANRIGRGWYKRIRDVQAGQELNGGRALFGEDVDGLIHALTESTNMSNDEARAFVARFQKEPGEGGVSRTKHRTLMDEHFGGVLKDNVTGEMVNVRLADIFENDSTKLFQMYNRQMSGQLALARLRIENPKWKLNPDSAPQYLVDGITKRSEWDTLMKQVASVSDEIGHDAKLRDKDLERLNFIHDAITGTGKPSNQMLRLLRDYNFIRVMNQVGFAQIADAGQLLGQAGFRAAIEGMPSLRSLWRNAKTGRLDDGLANELEYITQGGTDWMRGSAGNRFDDWGEHTLLSSSGSTLDKAEAVLEKGKRAVNVMSFMAPVNVFLQRWAAKASLARLINEASGATSTNLNRLRAMGLSDDMAQRVQNELKTKVTYLDNEVRVGKIKDTNFDQWDPEVRNAFENTLWRMSRRLVQENDIGQSNMFFSSDMGKMLFQFRAFMLSAWSKQFLYGINMRDWQSFVGFTATSVLGAGVYIGQTYLQSIGRSDREKFLNDRLSPTKIGEATFQRAGWASFMPMGVDFGAEAFGLDPLFDTRASGLTSKWFGNPTGDLVDKLHKGIGGAAATITRGSPFTQPDARRLLSVLPFQNFLPWMNTYNAFISTLPEKEPRRSRN